MNTGFNFSDFITELRNDDNKKHIIESYESCFGKIDPDIKKQIWYIEYVKGFEKFYPKEGVRAPEELQQEFDWKLLFVLVVSSFSSEYRLERPETDSNEGWRLWIKVTSKEESIEKSLDELWSFQIYRLFEIYTEEQINLQLLRAEGEDEWEAVNIERFEKIKKSLKQTKKPEKDEIVYHYTSISTFTELLKTNTLRASDLRFLNDKTEKTKWFNVFDEASKEVSRKMSNQNGSAQKKEFLDKIGENIKHYRTTECYIFCLSRLPDDKSQFNDYGDKSKGVSIGFNRGKLMNILFKFNDADEDTTFVKGMLHGNVEYDEQLLQNELISKIENLLEKCEKSGKNIQDFFDCVSNLNDFNKDCRRIFCRCQDAKDRRFQSEKEYRIYWMQESNNRNKKIGLFSRNNRIIPYVDLEFGDEKLPISEIIVGPDNKIEVVENIKEVLLLLGYSNVNVKLSEIPYIS